MKPRILTWITAMTLVAALAIPARLAAQEHSSQFRQYKLIDLGTLGALNGGAFAAGSLRNRAIVAGAADTAIPNPPNANPFIVVNCAGSPFVSHAFVWKEGVETDLGSLPGINCSGAGGINRRGEVAGASENGVIDPLLGVTESHAVLWKDGEIIDLGTLEGGNEI